MARRYGPIASLYLLLAAVATAVTTFGYLRLLGQQGSAIGESSRVGWVLAFLLVMVVLACIGTFAGNAAVRAIAGAACAGGLLVLGIAAAFSIGIPLIAAGILSFVGWLAAIREGVDRRTTAIAVAASVAAPVVLLTGFALTA